MAAPATDAPRRLAPACIYAVLQAFAPTMFADSRARPTWEGADGDAVLRTSAPCGGHAMGARNGRADRRPGHLGAGIQLRDAVHAALCSGARRGRPDRGRRLGGCYLGD